MTNEEAKAFLDNLKICIDEHPIVADWLVEIADRKTEPQYSEDDMYWLSLAEDVANGKMSDAGANQAWLEYINHKDEPTGDKLSAVDKDINVRSKDEPQTERSSE